MVIVIGVPVVVVTTVTGYVKTEVTVRVTKSVVVDSVVVVVGTRVVDSDVTVLKKVVEIIELRTSVVVVVTGKEESTVETTVR